jgi:hypothetical protein
MVADLGGHRLPGCQRDVRRVGDDHIHRAVELLKATVDVGLVQDHTGALEVAPGPHARLGRLLHRVHDGAGVLGGDRAGDGSGSRAQVDDERILLAREAFQHPADHHLGLRPGHEDARTDDQFAIPEGRRTGQVLQRLAGRAPRHQLVVRRPLRLADLGHPEPGPAGPAHVGEQFGRVVLGRGDTGLRQPPGATGNNLARRGHRAVVGTVGEAVVGTVGEAVVGTVGEAVVGGHRVVSAVARRSARSASVSAWITGAMSPVMKWSRL